MTIYGFWRWAQADPGRVAVIDPSGGQVTYGEMAAECHRLSRALARLGVGEGDRLLLAGRNGLRWLQVWFAGSQLGVSTVPVSWHMRARELAYILADSKAKALVADETAAAAAAIAAEAAAIPRPRRLSVVPLEGFTDLASLMAGESSAPLADPRTAAALLYTSGTSGRPKGVLRPAPPVLADGQLPAGVHRDLEHGMTVGEGVNLTVAPLYHIGPSRAAIDALETGLTMVLMDRWDAEGVLARIERHRVTSFFMPPVLLQRLAALPADVRDRHDVSSVRTITHGGAPCPPSVKYALIDWFGPIVWEIYGGTEYFASHVGSVDWLAHPGTVGRAQSGQSDVRIVDEDRRVLPAGEIGYIEVGNAMGRSFQYLGDPEKTRAAVGADGYVTIGDLGYIDADGWLFVSDRRSDLIISGGVNVYPAEVEAILHEHEAIRDAGVIGIPDDEYGQRVHAVVSLAAAARPSAELERTLTAHCRSALASFKVPRGFSFVDEVPRSEAGKVLRAQIRAPYWAAREPA